MKNNKHQNEQNDPHKKPRLCPEPPTSEDNRSIHTKDVTGHDLKRSSQLSSD
jgi:hypothetical protein